MVQGQPYDHNGHGEVTYETFCKEPHINVSRSLKFHLLLRKKKGRLLVRKKGVLR
jgi:hypothetical protein